MANFFPVTLVFNNIPAQAGPIDVTINQPDPGQWSVGDVTEAQAGLTINAPGGGSVSFSNLTITPKQIIFFAADQTLNIQITLNVNTTQSRVSGQALLPGGVSGRASSGVDTTSLGEGSWSLKLQN